jgi:4-hydroxybenzoate polyprenyltransferase
VRLNSIFQHLRFPFSVLLLPIFLFALSMQPQLLNNNRTWLLFLILHLLVYPSSNAYNSIQDKDEGSIGLIKNPLPIDGSLIWVCIILDALALFLGLLISLKIFLFIAIYIIASRLYSYRKIRLKQYPIIGFLTVFIFQGGFIYLMVCSLNFKLNNILIDNILEFLASSCLIGCMYPLSQIYQHSQDKEDGVTTISMVLGYNGTFVFSALLFTCSGIFLTLIFWHNLFAILAITIASITVSIYFFYWWYKVSQQTLHANYKNTMIMNLLSCIAFNTIFLIILIYNYWHLSII